MEPNPHNSRFHGWIERLSRPVDATAIDVFRILSGLLTCAYFVRHFLEFRTYTSESGLLDHRLLRELFWFTELTLFYPGSSDIYKLGLLIIGFLGAIALTLGARPKYGAGVAWIVAVSVQRWNFAVINVDDSSITLLLWWMLFLPIGHSLTWRTLSGTSSWKEESKLKVHGFFMRALFANLFIYYLTAGLTKLGSELWREGLALYVILNLPLARTQGWWGPEHMSLLWFGNHFTLIMEPLFPFMVLLRTHHPLKWFGGLSLFVFHLSIPLTIGVPYANFALIACLAPIFHKELGGFFRKRAGVTGQVLESPWRPGKGTRQLIATYLVVLFLAMQKNVPILGAVWEPAMGVLYWGGVAQEYHLFDWIDRFNWTVSHRITVHPDEGDMFTVPSQELFPHSVRGFIIQSYLLPMRWMRVPRPLTGEMRNAVLQRAARRFVREQKASLGSSGRVFVESTVGRLTRDDLEGQGAWNMTLAELRYQGSDVSFEFPRMPGEVQP